MISGYISSLNTNSPDIPFKYFNYKSDPNKINRILSDFDIFDKISFFNSRKKF